MRLKCIFASIILCIGHLFPITSIKAENLSLKELPFSGYYLAPEESGIEGLLFQENQLLIYIKDDSRYAHSANQHDHGQTNIEENHYHHKETDTITEQEYHADVVDQEFIEWLFEFNSFPYPDLQAYSASVQERYKEENNLPIDLKDDYQAIVNQITPEMTQRNVIDLINSSIPDISYTQKNNYNYFIISCPTVIKNEKAWTVELFGEEIFTFSQNSGQLEDNHGNIYTYIDGIAPN